MLGPNPKAMAEILETAMELDAMTGPGGLSNRRPPSGGLNNNNDDSSPSSTSSNDKRRQQHSPLQKTFSNVEKEMQIFKAKMKEGDDDARQRVEVFGRFLASCYQVSMGSMLLLFVPQNCPDTNRLDPTNTHVCTLNEILHPATVQKAVNPMVVVHLAALVCNLVNLLVNMLLYSAELKRENWCIDHLDIDKNVSDNNARKVLRENPVLDQDFQKLNEWYYMCCNWARLFFVINNLIVSPIALFLYPNGGVLSNEAIALGLTPMVSQSALLMLRLNTAKWVVGESKTKKIAHSAYMIELVSYNVIDPDVVGKKGGQKARETLMNTLEKKYLDLTQPQPHVVNKLPVTLRARNLLKSHTDVFEGNPHHVQLTKELAGEEDD